VRSRLAALLAAGLTLTACGGGGGNSGGGGGWFGWLTGPSAPTSCPAVSKVGEATKLVRFAPGSNQDLNNVQFEAGIFDVGGGCTNMDNGVKVDMTADIAAARGPADTTGKASFAYFVAIVDDNQNIIAREEYPLEIAFPGNQTRNGQREQLEETIPLTKDQQAAAFHIYIGIVLTKDEVAYNRAHP